MEVREEQVFTNPVVKKMYYPNLGHFVAIIPPQKFENRDEAISYQQILNERNILV